MSVIMSNKSRISNNGVNEAGTSCEGRNQTATNKTPLNADNEDNMMVLGEEEREDLFGSSMKITSFNGFSCESSDEDDIDTNYNNKERQT